MQAKRILIVDDDRDTCESLKQALTHAGYQTQAEMTGESAMAALGQFHPDLILLDYRLPGQSGAEVVRQIRGHEEHHAVSIIMVSGLDGEEEKVAALELGADDYVVKPFSPNELKARVQAVLRRSQILPSAVSTVQPAAGFYGLETSSVGPVSGGVVSGPDNGIEFDQFSGHFSAGMRGGMISRTAQRLGNGALLVDLQSHRVYQNGIEVALTLTEYKILVELLKAENSVLSRDHLRQTALSNLNVTDRTIDVHMASLRKKLASSADSIQTVRGVGYRYSHV